MDISIARYLLCDKGFVPYNVQSHWYVNDYTSECSLSHIDVFGWFPYSHMVIWYINDLYINDEFTSM